MSIFRPAALLKNLFKKPMTLQFPYQALPPVEGYRGRHFLDLEKCTGCPVCSLVCPNKAIELVKVGEEEKKGKIVDKLYPQIHLGKCCFCALCEEYCPRDAIHMTHEAMISIMDKDQAVYGPDKLAQPVR